MRKLKRAAQPIATGLASCFMLPAHELRLDLKVLVWNSKDPNDVECRSRSRGRGHGLDAQSAGPLETPDPSKGQTPPASCDRRGGRNRISQ